jgi:hypothetical protein
MHSVGAMHVEPVVVEQPDGGDCSRLCHSVGTCRLLPCTGLQVDLDVGFIFMPRCVL